MNKDFYDSLTQEQQTIIDEAAAEFIAQQKKFYDSSIN